MDGTGLAVGAARRGGLGDGAPRSRAHVPPEFVPGLRRARFHPGDRGRHDGRPRAKRTERLDVVGNRFSEKSDRMRIEPGFPVFPFKVVGHIRISVPSELAKRKLSASRCEEAGSGVSRGEPLENAVRRTAVPVSSPVVASDKTTESAVARDWRVRCGRCARVARARRRERSSPAAYGPAGGSSAANARHEARQYTRGRRRAIARHRGIKLRVVGICDGR